MLIFSFCHIDLSFLARRKIFLWSVKDTDSVGYAPLIYYTNNLKKRIFSIVASKVRMAYILLKLVSDFVWQCFTRNQKPDDEPPDISCFCKNLYKCTAPGVPPSPSDQGMSVTCTIHALAKCVVSAMDKKGIDVDQDEAIKIVRTCNNRQNMAIKT